MKLSSRSQLLILITLSLSCALSGKAFSSDFHSPRTDALGGAGHAGPLLNDAIYLNPSFTSFLPSQSFSLNYSKFRGPSVNRGGTPTDIYGQTTNISVQDGRSDLFQAGVGYTRREDATFIHVGASKAVLRQWGVGIGGKFFWLNNNDVNRQVKQDFSVATAVVPARWLQTSLLLDNLLQTDLGKTANLYREITLGTKFNAMGIALVYIDPHVTPSLPGDQRWGYEAGLELAVFQDFFLRFGNFRNSVVPWENQRGRGFGAGFGWIAPRLSLDFGISRDIDPLAATDYSFGATMFF